MNTTASSAVDTKLRAELGRDGQVARIILAAPKANILDQTMMRAFIDALRALPAANLKAIIVDSEGPHFSFGASIQEHLPGQIKETLALLRSLLEALLNAPAPTIAAVRGQCLGGGLELALACDLIYAEEGSHFGLPEIKLGVFPPAGAALLPVKIGAARSAELVLTGESWTAEHAMAGGLVGRIAARGMLAQHLETWIQSDFLPRPAVALRYASEASRRPLLRALKTELPELERLYLDKLMSHPDSVEGIRAFLERRPQRASV